MTRTVTPGTNLSLGYLGEFGGVQKVDGVENGFATDRHAVRVNLQQMLLPTTMLSVTAAHDVAVRDGFRSPITVTARADRCRAEPPGGVNLLREQQTRASRRTESSARGSRISHVF